MFTHRVAEYFGDIIEVEFKNKPITTPTETHYGDVPWSKNTPLFATRDEKYKSYINGITPKLTEKVPVFCTSIVHKRLFKLQAGKTVTTPQSGDKPERRRATLST